MKSEEEIQEEIDDPNTKCLIIAPMANNAYLLDRVTINFPVEIDSIVGKESITLKGKMDIIKRKALVGLQLYPCQEDEEKAEDIEEFVDMIQEAEGEKLDYLASEHVQNQFRGGRWNQEFEQQ